MKRIALDLDNTLADTLGVYKQKYVQNPGSVENYDFSNSEHDLEHFLEKTDELWTYKPDFIPPTEQNLDIYTLAINEFYEIDVVTARPTAPKCLEWWLEEHGITYKNLIHSTQDKHGLGYDVIVDDNPYVHEQIKTRNETGVVYDKAFNKEVEADHRIENFKELVNKVYNKVI